MGDLVDEFLVDDLVVAVEDEDGTSHETGERTVHHANTPGLAKLAGAEGGESGDVRKLGGIAESACSEGKISRDVEDDHILQTLRLVVETRGRKGADRGVKRRDDGNDLDLAFEILQALLAQIRSNKSEVGSNSANGGKLASKSNRSALECSGHLDERIHTQKKSEQK